MRTCCPNRWRYPINEQFVWVGGIAASNSIEIEMNRNILYMCCRKEICWDQLYLNQTQDVGSYIKHLPYKTYPMLRDIVTKAFIHCWIVLKHEGLFVGAFFTYKNISGIKDTHNIWNEDANIYGRKIFGTWLSKFVHAYMKTPIRCDQNNTHTDKIW